MNEFELNNDKKLNLMNEEDYFDIHRDRRDLNKQELCVNPYENLMQKNELVEVEDSLIDYYLDKSMYNSLNIIIINETMTSS